MPDNVILMGFHNIYPPPAMIGGFVHFWYFFLICTQYQIWGGTPFFTYNWEMSNGTRYHFGWWYQKFAEGPKNQLVVDTVGIRPSDPPLMSESVML